MTQDKALYQILHTTTASTRHCLWCHPLDSGQAADTAPGRLFCNFWLFQSCHSQLHPNFYQHVDCTTRKKQDNWSTLHKREGCIQCYPPPPTGLLWPQRYTVTTCIQACIQPVYNLYTTCLKLLESYQAVNHASTIKDSLGDSNMILCSKLC